jgi:hypothetical protein
VSKIEEFEKEIEDLRLNMVKVKEGKLYTDPEVVVASQELDGVMDKYYEMLMKKEGLDQKRNLTIS